MTPSRPIPTLNIEEASESDSSVQRHRTESVSPRPFLSRGTSEVSRLPYSFGHESHSSPSLDGPLNVIDQIPEAHQNVTSHDRLWAEMDSLEEDAARARQVLRNRGFLGTEHANALAALRKTQIQFAQAIANEEDNLALSQYRELWKMGDPEMLRTRLFADPHFDLLKRNVAESTVLLDEISSVIEKDRHASS